MMNDFPSPTEIDGHGRGVVGVKVVIADGVSDGDVGPVIPVVAATVRCAVLLAILSAAVFLFVTGCSGYHIGTDALYTSEIKTVFVPMVEADTYRRGIGERLTEAVCKKITERTPFDLASSKDADSVLHIRLVADSQYVSGLDAYNNTRQKKIWSGVSPPNGRTAATPRWPAWTRPR